MEGWQSLVYCDSPENYWGCVEHPPWVRIPHPLPLNTKGENMYKHLYDSFSHWYRGGSIYFYSDPHFNDDEMEYLRKHYIGDDEQVKAINRKIGKNDTIVFLGDIGCIDFIRKIRGYKVLICGNHDVGATKYKKEKRTVVYDADIYSAAEAKKKVKEEYPNWRILSYDDDYVFHSPFHRWIFQIDNGLFDEVYEGPLCISEKIILSHEPIDIPFMYNIHGHDHSGWGFKDNRHYNMCAEHISYTPVGIKEIVESGYLKNIKSIHRITIDEATHKKESKKE